MGGVSNARGSGIGIVLESPKGTRVEHLLRLGYQALNNEAEYEKLIVEFRAIVKVGATEVGIYLESRLMVSRVKGDFKVRDLRMVDYLKLVRSLQAQFRSMKVTQISRGQNNYVNSLATLASSVGSLISWMILVESLESLSINHQEHCQVAATAILPS